MRTSAYRGVTLHRHTMRWEAHVWLRTEGPRDGLPRGRQVYVGGYRDELTAARAYDLASLKLRPEANAERNFPPSTYAEFEPAMRAATQEAWILFLRRGLTGWPARAPDPPEEPLWTPPVMAEAPIIFR